MSPSEAVTAGAAMLSCAMCGHRYAPAGTTACSSCPLGGSCSLACCPNCGYGEPVPGASTLVRLARRLLGARARRRDDARPALTLADAPPRAQVEITSVDDVPAAYRDQLLAYGIAPGRVVDVIQARPLTIVRIEHVELALERVVGAAIAAIAVPEERRG